MAWRHAETRNEDRRRGAAAINARPQAGPASDGRAAELGAKGIAAAVSSIISQGSLRRRWPPVASPRRYGGRLCGSARFSPAAWARQRGASGGWPARRDSPACCATAAWSPAMPMDEPMLRTRLNMPAETTSVRTDGARWNRPRWTPARTPGQRPGSDDRRQTTSAASMSALKCAICHSETMVSSRPAGCARARRRRVQAAAYGHHGHQGADAARCQQSRPVVTTG